MKKQQIIIAIALVALIVGAIFLSQGKKNEIVIGLSGPMTGSAAVYGEQMKKAAEMIVNKANEAGGIGGKKLRLEVADDACDPKQAVTAAGQLVNLKAQFVVGDICTHAAVPLSEVLNENNIPYITVGASNPIVTERGMKDVFRIFGRDDVQSKVWSDIILNQYRDKKVALLYDRSGGPQMQAELAKKYLDEHDFNLVMYDSITAGDKDYSAVITKLKQAGAEVVMVSMFQTEAGLIVRQAHEQGLNAIFAGTDPLSSSEFWSITGAAGEGTLFTFVEDPREKPEAKDIVAGIRAAGIEPDSYTLYTYAAFQVALDALTKQAQDKGDMADILRGQVWTTLLGPVQFNDKGDNVNAKFVVNQWHDGKYQMVDGTVEATPIPAAMLPLSNVPAITGEPALGSTAVSVPANTITPAAAIPSATNQPATIKGVQP